MQRSKGSDSGSVWPVNAHHLSALHSPFTDIMSESEVPNVHPCGDHRMAPKRAGVFRPARHRGGRKIKKEEGERKDEKVWLRSTEKGVKERKKQSNVLSSVGKDKRKGKWLHLPHTRSNLKKPTLQGVNPPISSLILVLGSLGYNRDTEIHRTFYTQESIHRLYAEDENSFWSYTGVIRVTKPQRV